MSVRTGTGHSTKLEAAEAGREAASRAMAGLGGEKPALIIVFTTPRYDLPALLAAIRSVTGDARLIGATGSGEIVHGRYLGFGAGVAVLAMTAGPYRFGFASAGHIRDDLHRAGQMIARRSRAEAGESPHGTLLLLADMMLGDLQQLVQGTYRVTGPKASVVGGAAGDEQKFVASFVFLDDAVVEQGAVGMWIASDRPLTVVTRHGWKPYSPPMLVTRAEGITVMELGGRPAAEVYEERLGLAPGQLTPEMFWSTSIHYPLGLLQPDGSTVVRIARAKTREGHLRIQGNAPQLGSAVEVMHGDADMLLGIVPGVAATALEANPEAGVLLAFSCAARAAMFKERTAEEAVLLQAAAGKVPTFGLYCCGEFARTMGVLGTHNGTLTTLAL